MRRLARRLMPAGAHVWLYGSRARGEQHPASDWDLLILLDKPRSEPHDFDTFAYPFVELGWDYTANVNPQVYTYGEWASRAITPYYNNVEHDKVMIG